MFCLRSVSRQSFRTSGRRGVVTDGRRLGLLLLQLGQLGLDGLPGGDLRLEVLPGGPLVVGLVEADCSAVVAAAALLLHGAGPDVALVLRAGLADADHELRTRGAEVHHQRVVQPAGDLAVRALGDGEVLAREDPRQARPTVGQGASGGRVLADVGDASADVLRLLLALGDLEGPEVEQDRVLHDGEFSRTEGGNDFLGGVERRGNQDPAVTDFGRLASAESAGGRLVGLELLRGLVGRIAGRSAAAGGGAGNGGGSGDGEDQRRRLRNRGCGDTARVLPASVAGVELRLALGAADGEGGGGDDERGDEAEVLDHVLRAPDVGVVVLQFAGGRGKLFSDERTTARRRTFVGHFRVVERSRDLKSRLESRPVQGRKSAPFVFGHCGLLSMAVAYV